MRFSDDDFAKLEEKAQKALSERKLITIGPNVSHFAKPAPTMTSKNVAKTVYAPVPDKDFALPGGRGRKTPEKEGKTDDSALGKFALNGVPWSDLSKTYVKEREKAEDFDNFVKVPQNIAPLFEKPLDKPFPRRNAKK